MSLSESQLLVINSLCTNNEPDCRAQCKAKALCQNPLAAVTFQSLQ